MATERGTRKGIESEMSSAGTSQRLVKKLGKV